MIINIYVTIIIYNYTPKPEAFSVSDASQCTRPVNNAAKLAGPCDAVGPSNPEYKLRHSG